MYVTDVTNSRITLRKRHYNNNSSNRLLGFCNRKAGLDNATYTYKFYKIHKIHNNSHATEDVGTVTQGGPRK